MTKERKASATWYIAATHYLTAGFVVPFIANLAFGFVLASGLIPNLPIGMGLAVIVNAVGIWFGVVYSARFLERAYLIPNPEKVITLATIYYVVINALFVAGGFLTRSVDADSATEMIALISTAMPVIGAIIFYIASKKFVTATSAGSA